MGTLELEGETLGQRHRYYNKLVKEFTSTNASQLIKEIDYNKPDIDNLFIIDIASREKDVDFILKILQCEDMLYVSRALKQSVWLITDAKYADIVKPDYLHGQLLPQMTSKAGHKLLLTIRLNLKDEKRVEQFYNYYEDKKDIRAAIKWLPNCSIPCIENAVEKHYSDMSDNLLKRLCERSITILEICARVKHTYDIRSLLSETMFLINNNTEKFVTIINSQDTYSIPKLNSKATKLIMERKPDIILNNFEKFAWKIDIPTFVKFIKGEDVKPFLMKHLVNKNLKSWFTFEIMKHFIYRIPNENRFSFIKTVCIEKTQDSSEDVTYDDDEQHIGLTLSSCIPQSSNANLYKWYKFAPFSIAYADLKKQIRIESNPSERNEIFAVLIACARQNPQNLRRVLQHYRDKHINEPFKFKSHFVNILLGYSNSHRFDEETWNILNEIFYSMEVYSENKNNVQTCLKHIIIRNVINDTKVSDIIEKKFEFDTLKSLQKKLDAEEKDKVFHYLYQLITKKIQGIKIDSEGDLRAVIENIKNALNLLRDWKKNLLNYSIILEKIKEITKIKCNKEWNEDLSDIYNTNKSWRKHMFTESLFLYPSQETCINALKHCPEMVLLRKEIICLKDVIILNRFFNKIRVYWPKTLAKSFEDTFRNHLNDITKHKGAVRGLCVLLPKKHLNDILSKYIPSDSKINWSETDEFTLSIQKSFAKYMLLARPHPPVDIVLSYAKGDYLQFVVPSVQSILFNISINQSLKHISTLLDAPVSLQKHGLNIAFAKLKINDILAICLNTWKSTKNSSIRTSVFKLVYELLCKEQDENNIKEIWPILDSFIDNLTSEENRVIYLTLSQAKKVPNSVKQAFSIKSYRFLKSLPPKANCDSLCRSVVGSILDLMESTDLDLDFMYEVIFDSIDNKITKTHCTCVNLISNCLLFSKSEMIQTQRYEKIFVPLLQKILALMKDTESKQPLLKSNFKSILRELLINVGDIILNKNIIMPIKLFHDIHDDLEKYLPGEDYYVLIITWKLAAKYVKLLDNYRHKGIEMPDKDVMKYDINDTKRNIIYLEAAPEFGKICIDQLKEDIIKYSPSIYRLFSMALNAIFQEINLSTETLLTTLKAIQEHADIPEGHLLVIYLIPSYMNDEEKEKKNILFQAYSSHSSTEVRMHYNEMFQDE